jgi:hemerythrin
MAKVQWADDLSIGIDVIDEQHKMLIQHLNDVHTAVMSNQGPNVIARTLGFLIKYTDFHFNTEESYMAKCNYPGLQHQVAEHNEFKRILMELEQDFIEDGPTHNLGIGIDTLLINWLLVHIYTVDLKFGQYLRDNNIELSV